MIALLIIAAYVAVGLATARRVYLRIEADIESRRNRRSSYDRVNELDEGHAVGACGAGLIWPITLCVLLVGRRTPTQRRKEVQRELAELEAEVNRLRKEHDLP